MSTNLTIGVMKKLYRQCMNQKPPTEITVRCIEDCNTCYWNKKCKDKKRSLYE